jgi:glutathione S-transferase
MNSPIQLVGATASPYTQKMLALLRYRRLPYAVTWGDPGARCDALGVERPRPVLMPTFFFDGEAGLQAACDSTPIIRRLEAEHAGRSVLPNDPALAFVDYLVEDFADEWCTKYMFHFRWHSTVDADNAGTLLPLTTDISMSTEALAQAKTLFSQRQIGRLHVVGSNERTAPLIDASYRRLLAAMEDILASQRFVLGNRPGAGDFGLYGQLSQLVGFDPTPRAIALEIAPRTVAWVDMLRDLSGLEPEDQDWASVEQLAPTIRSLLKEIGRVYAPAQIANARAFAAGEATWETEIDGATWTQPTFPYQVKCLKWTRQAFQALSAEDRVKVDRILEETGADAMLSGD